METVSHHSVRAALGLCSFPGLGFLQGSAPSRSLFSQGDGDKDSPARGMHSAADHLLPRVPSWVEVSLLPRALCSGDLSALQCHQACRPSHPSSAFLPPSPQICKGATKDERLQWHLPEGAAFSWLPNPESSLEGRRSLVSLTAPKPHPFCPGPVSLPPLILLTTGL